jgi:hypothetical protein
MALTMWTLQCSPACTAKDSGLVRESVRLELPQHFLPAEPGAKARPAAVAEYTKRTRLVERHILTSRTPVMAATAKRHTFSIAPLLATEIHSPTPDLESADWP